MWKDFIKIINRTWNLIIFPRAEWFRISVEKDPHFFRKYFIFYLVLTTVSYFGGVLVDDSRSLIMGSVGAVVKGFGMPFMLMVISTYLIYAISPLFDSAKNLALTYKLVIYSLTPFLLVSLVTNFVHQYMWLNLLGFYGAVLLYHGMPDILKTPLQKHTPYIVLSIVFITAVFTGLQVGLDLLAALVYRIF